MTVFYREKQGYKFTYGVIKRYDIEWNFIVVVFIDIQ